MVRTGYLKKPFTVWQTLASSGVKQELLMRARLTMKRSPALETMADRLKLVVDRDMPAPMAVSDDGHMYYNPDFFTSVYPEADLKLLLPLYIGITGHEVAHLLYTDFRTSQNVIPRLIDCAEPGSSREWDDLMAQLFPDDKDDVDFPEFSDKVRAHAPFFVQHFLHHANIFEDGFIEPVFIAGYPGKTADCLAYTRKFFWRAQMPLETLQIMLDQDKISRYAALENALLMYAKNRRLKLADPDADTLPELLGEIRTLVPYVQAAVWETDGQKRFYKSLRTVFALRRYLYEMLKEYEEARKSLEALLESLEMTKAGTGKGPAKRSGKQKAPASEVKRIVKDMKAKAEKEAAAGKEKSRSTKAKAASPEKDADKADEATSLPESGKDKAKAGEGLDPEASAPVSGEEGDLKTEEVVPEAADTGSGEAEDTAGGEPIPGESSPDSEADAECEGLAPIEGDPDSEGEGEPDAEGSDAGEGLGDSPGDGAASPDAPVADDTGESIGTASPDFGKDHSGTGGQGERTASDGPPEYDLFAEVELDGLEGDLPELEETDASDMPLEDDLLDRLWEDAETEGEEVLEALEAARAFTEQLQAELRETPFGTVHSRMPAKLIRETYTESHRDRYEKIKQETEFLVNNLCDALKEYFDQQSSQRVKKHQYYGTLSERDMYRKDMDAFVQERRSRPEPRLSIGFLGDESGSMSSGNRIPAVIRTAVVLTETCEQLGIPLLVCGHTESFGHSSKVEFQLHSYIDPASPDADQKYSIPSMKARENNRDGMALEYMYEKMRCPEMEAQTRLLFICSDGQPAADGYYGSHAIEDVLGILAKNEDIVTIAAGIGEDRGQVEAIYGERYLNVSNLNEMPDLLLDIITQYML